jgi:glycosyltransferase involved in cell wall biosynthesis
VDLGRGLVWQHLVGLRRYLRSFRPDLVHVNRELWTIVAQEVVGLDAAVVVHGAENLWHHGNSVEQFLRRRLVDRAIRRIHGYASWNHAGVDHVVRRRRELGLAAVPTLVLPAIVPPVTFRDVSWRPSPDGPVEVALVGRAVSAKGFQDVLEAADEVPGIRVTLCGEGPLLDDLARLAERHRVSLVTPGHLPPTQLARLMARSHVLVQPSRTTDDWAEQFGRSVAEAMTVGLPVLVSDSGELPHLVGEDPEAVFPEGDSVALRAHLQRLAGDRGGLRALAARQHELASTWEPAVAGTALLGFWQQVLG